MSELSQAQLDQIQVAVDAKGEGKWKFGWAASTNADKKLAVVAVYANDGELRTVTVKVGEDANWLSNPEQFGVVVGRMMNALGRP
jgi:hypothetical protein